MTVKIRLFNGATDWAYIQSHVSVVACEDTCGVVAYNEETGEQYGAVVFDNFTESSVQAHICISNTLAIRHKLIEEAAGFAYLHCGREVIIGLVPASNVRALRFDKHIGFTEVTRIRDGFKRGVDYVVLEMRFEDCELLNYFDIDRSGLEFRSVSNG